MGCLTWLSGSSDHQRRALHTCVFQRSPPPVSVANHSPPPTLSNMVTWLCRWVNLILSRPPTPAPHAYLAGFSNGFTTSYLGSSYICRSELSRTNQQSLLFLCSPEHPPPPPSISVHTENNSHGWLFLAVLVFGRSRRECPPPPIIVVQSLQPLQSPPPLPTACFAFPSLAFARNTSQIEKRNEYSHQPHTPS